MLHLKLACVGMLIATPLHAARAANNKPFVDAAAAQDFANKSFSTIMHHEEQQCGTTSIQFEITIILPIKDSRNREFVVVGPPCAHERKAEIEKVLRRMRVSAFKKPRKPTSYTFRLNLKFDDDTPH